MKNYEILIFSNRDFFIKLMKTMLENIIDCNIYCEETFQGFRSMVLLKDIKMIIIDENAIDLKIESVKSFITQRHVELYVNNLIYLSLRKKEIKNGIYNNSIFKYLNYEFKQVHQNLPKTAETNASFNFSPSKIFTSIWDNLYEKDYNFTGDLNNDISMLLNEFKMTNNFKGELYLKEAIKYIVENSIKGIYVTKIIYPEIASKFNTTSQAVERDIRTAISKSYNNLSKIYPKILNHKKPTNMQFLIAVSERLRLFYEKSEFIVKPIDE